MEWEEVGMTCTETFMKIIDDTLSVIKEKGDENLTDRDVEIMKVNYLGSIAMSLAMIADTLSQTEEETEE